MEQLALLEQQDQQAQMEQQEQQVQLEQALQVQLDHKDLLDPQVAVAVVV
jgi:hypothetical protein